MVDRKRCEEPFVVELGINFRVVDIRFRWRPGGDGVHVGAGAFVGRALFRFLLLWVQ